MSVHHVSKRLGHQGSVLLWLMLAVALPLWVLGLGVVADAARPDFPHAPVATAGSSASMLAGLLNELTGDNGDLELAIALPFVFALVVVQTGCYAPRFIFASHVVLIDTPPPRRLA